MTQTFCKMLRERQGEKLDEWLLAVKASGIAELISFATGIERDYQAVKAGLTLKWSNGITEGQINRLKLLKRQTYGRAGFALLERRVLHREVKPAPKKSVKSVKIENQSKLAA